MKNKNASLIPILEHGSVNTYDNTYTGSSLKGIGTWNENEFKKVVWFDGSSLGDGPPATVFNIFSTLPLIFCWINKFLAA